MSDVDNNTSASRSLDADTQPETARRLIAVAIGWLLLSVTASIFGFFIITPCFANLMFREFYVSRIFCSAGIFVFRGFFYKACTGFVSLYTQRRKKAEKIAQPELLCSQMAVRLRLKHPESGGKL